MGWSDQHLNLEGERFGRWEWTTLRLTAISPYCQAFVLVDAPSEKWR